MYLSELLFYSIHNLDLGRINFLLLTLWDWNYNMLYKSIVKIWIYISFIVNYLFTGSSEMKVIASTIALLLIIIAVFFYTSSYRSAFEADQACHLEKWNKYQSTPQYGCDHDLETRQWLLYQKGDENELSVVLKRYRYWNLQHLILFSISLKYSLYNQSKRFIIFENSSIPRAIEASPVSTNVDIWPIDPWA